MPDWLPHAHALVLSHAHIDHSGNIPTVVAPGFSGNIYCTPATRDLASVMRRDAAMVQAQDTAYLNKRAAKEGRRERLEPLCTRADAEKTVGLMFSVPLRRPLDIAPGVRMRLHDAGHVLGSSVIELDNEEGAKKTRFVFTGDLGCAEVPLLRDPEVVEGVDVLLIESKYGDRLHRHPRPGDLRTAALVHGEGGPRRVLKKKLEDPGIPSVVIAEKGEKLGL